MHPLQDRPVAKQDLSSLLDSPKIRRRVDAPDDGEHERERARKEKPGVEKPTESNQDRHEPKAASASLSIVELEDVVAVNLEQTRPAPLYLGPYPFGP
jgi:hypothetical protein